MFGLLEHLRHAFYPKDADEQPPITPASLAELDMSEIINNSKLRHDVNFDRELHFRPDLDGSNGRQKILQAELYWVSLEAEIFMHNKLLLRKTAANESHCARIAPPPIVQLQNFFTAVRNILLSLVLDHDQEEVKGRLNLQIVIPMLDLCELATWLAKVLKNHCAPMRDGMVDEMACTVQEGVEENNPSKTVDGLRQLMDVLEAMKLDFANHQIRHLRPLSIDDPNQYLGRRKPHSTEIAQRNSDEAGREFWYQRLELHKRTPWVYPKRYSDLILQPEFSPICQEQLAAEVKGICAGLAMVEAKCISIDAAQAASSEPLGPEQWQALIALHRTLLCEYHDFLIATQHTSATAELRFLATRCNIPERLWRHGICGFLEVLRHRQPESRDYMLDFIYMAYRVMALLLETAPAFTDTWIECLGDLARYRMTMGEPWGADGLGSFRTRLCNDLYDNISDDDLDPEGWIALADFLNTLAHVHREPTDVGGTSGIDHDDRNPSSEDFLMRGLIWAQFYFQPDWFDSQTEDDEALPEPSSSPNSRAERILWLGLYLAFDGGNLHYDVRTERFYPSRTATPATPNLRHENDFTYPGGPKPAHFQDCTTTATRLCSYIKRLLEIPNRLLLSLVPLHFAKCASAAPTGFPASNQTSPTTTAPAHDTFIQWTGSIEHKALLVTTWITALGAFANISQIAIRKPKTEPKMSGDLAIGFSLAAWVLVETAPSLTGLRTMLVTLWFAAESDYIARMCCVVKNGRAYFWASVMFGLFMAMFMAALQSDSRPTLASMLLTGLPSAAFFVSCAARVLPRAVGEPRAPAGQ